MSFGGRTVGSVEYDAHLNTDQLKRDAAGAEQTLKSAGDAAAKAFTGGAQTGASKFGGLLDTLKGKVAAVGTELKKPELQKGLLQGVGLGGGLLGFQTIAGAVSGAVDMLGDWATQAAEGEAADAKLTASLNANVKGWQAHTDEIDAAARAGVKLGFADDDVKNSLAEIAVHTKDVTKATTILSAAEDLARFKKIDLATASNILGKAYDGSTGALKKMGIELPKGAKGLDAIGLAAKAAAGQAQSFADTDLGKKSKLDASLDAMKEKLGGPIKGAFAAIVDFIGGPVVDAIDGLLSGIGNIGTAFDQLHRFIDPNYALIQDTDVALRDQAQAMGLNVDKVTQYIAQQKLLVLQQQAAATANAKNAIATEIQNHLTDDQILLAGRLTDQYKQYGITANDVAVIQQQVHDGTWQATTAQQENTQAVKDADTSIAKYQMSVAQANVADRHRFETQSRLAPAIKDTSNAIADQHSHYDDLNSAVKKNTAVDLGALKAKQESARAFGQWGEVVGSTTTSVVHDMRNFNAAWRGDWINIVNRIDTSAGSIHDTLVGMRQDTNQQLTKLEYDLAHPHQKEHTLAYLVKAMKRAQADLIKAENSGDADLIKEAQTAVADIQAEYDKLNGSVTLTTHFAWKGGEGTGGGQRGRTGVRASGGPIWPGDWIVGERGPERMRITPSGTGYVWPNSGSQRVGSAQTVNHTGTILIRVDGTNLPAGVTNEGLGAAIGATVSQAHLRTIGPRQYA